MFFEEFVMCLIEKVVFNFFFKSDIVYNFKYDYKIFLRFCDVYK